MFNCAIEWDLMTCANPAAKLKLFKDQHRQRFLTLAEVTTAQRRANGRELPMAGILPVAVYLGLRKSELLNLKWENVNLDS